MASLGEHRSWRRRRRWACALAVLPAVAAIVVSAAGASAAAPAFTWSSRQLFTPPRVPPPDGEPQGFVGVSCAGTALCVAVSADGHAFATSDPAEGASGWTSTSIAAGDPLLAVSCPTAGLCVAGSAGGRLLTSTNPGAAQPTWSSATLSAASIGAVSCPSTALCVALDDAGEVLASTDPAAGAATWVPALVDAAGAPLLTVSCPSTTLCVALDSFGDLLTSRQPAGGAAAWSVQRSPDPIAPRVLSCPSESRCVALDDEGNVSATSAPAIGAASWQSAGNVGIVDPAAVACSVVDRCVALGPANALAASDSPVDSDGEWNATSLADGLLLTGVSCPTDTRCVLVDRSGTVLVGDAPAPTGTIHVTLFGEGDGTIAAPGLSCSTVCSGSYPRGSRVTLTPAPSAGSTFAGWGGACAGSAPCEVVVGASTAITAGFALAPPSAGYRLSVSVGGMGSVSGAGIACPETCTSVRPPGTAEVLTATPAAGWHFAYWAGACAGGQRCRLTANADHAISALFVQGAARPLPSVRITDVRRLSARGAVRLRFVSTPAQAVLKCRLVRLRPHARGAPRPRFAACRSPMLYTHLRPGRYRFSVHAAQAGAATVRRGFTMR